MKVDILAFGTHPDDIEIACAGTIIKNVKKGKKVAIIDLTQGELGTRGNAKIRIKEAKESAKIMGVKFREFLGFKDGFFQGNENEIKIIIKYIRKYCPEIVLIPAPYDRHPDHGRSAKLIKDACFYSGLKKIASSYEGKKQKPWRPRIVLNYIQDYYHTPTFLIDISEEINEKIKAIFAFKSQFSLDEDKTITPISNPNFLKALKGRMAMWGRSIGADYAEGFISERLLGIKDIFDIQ